ncbi:hypothetical protein BJX68DRAFT_97874 [Aspergillus pseudodeflectus]|uniref:Uncharacterized protein n=1 Tax=Aspergillus pseudodeflectus TaxID=176178 RepID=A0ABR4K9H5_9EURO
MATPLLSYVVFLSRDPKRLAPQLSCVGGDRLNRIALYSPVWLSFLPYPVFLVRKRKLFTRQDQVSLLNWTKNLVLPWRRRA